MSYDDALIFQANQIPDDESGDAEDTNTDDGVGGGKVSPHDVHHKMKFDFPRLGERPDTKAPSRPVLRLPEDPKSLNGRQLTRTTLPRDRDMLKSNKSR